jgi:thiol-disulfide isomerase/thioredoxin
MKRIAIVLLLTLSSILASCGGTSEKTESGTQTGQQQQGKLQDQVKVAAPDFELKNLTEEAVKLSSLKGKIVVLNFWATWCPPCKEEIPGFLKTMEEYKDKDVVFVFVDVNEGKKTVETFLKEKNFTSMNPVLDETGEVAGMYGIRGIPRTFILDKEGYVLLSHEGFMDEGSLKASIEDAIKKSQK